MAKTKTSSVQLTIRQLKNQGRFCDITEHRIPHARGHGITKDLFGIIDVLALDPHPETGGFVGIQCCMGSGYKKHLGKLLIDEAENTYNWLTTRGGLIELWAWRKVKLKRGGKAMVWAPRVTKITLAMLMEENS